MTNAQYVHMKTVAQCVIGRKAEGGRRKASGVGLMKIYSLIYDWHCQVE